LQSFKDKQDSFEFQVSSIEKRRPLRFVFLQYCVALWNFESCSARNQNISSLNLKFLKIVKT